MDGAPIIPFEELDGGLGGGFGGVDDFCAWADRLLEESAQERVVGAAEDEGVGIEAVLAGLGAQFVEINFDDFGGDRVVGPSFFDEGDEEGAGSLNGAEAEGLACGEIGVALDSGFGGDAEDVAGLEAARAASAPGWMTPRTGTETAS